MENPAIRVRVSTKEGHVTLSRVTAERGGFKVLDTDTNDKKGRPKPPKPRKRVAPKPRAKTGAATTIPTESVADAPVDPKESE